MCTVATMLLCMPNWHAHQGLWLLCMPNVRHVIKTIKVRNQPETFLHEILEVGITG
jgi:hypothetical protein